jgi:hypothetical protein
MKALISSALGLRVTAIAVKANAKIAYVVMSA